MKIHIIRSNDTLWDLVQKYNIPFERLLEANPEIQDPEKLETGTKIRIPSGKIPVSPIKPIETEEEKFPKNEEAEEFLYSDPNPYALWEKESLWEDEESSSSAASFAPYHATEEGFDPAYLPPIGTEATQMGPPPIYPPPIYYYPYPYPPPLELVTSDAWTIDKESSSIEY